MSLNETKVFLSFIVIVGLFSFSFTVFAKQNSTVNTIEALTVHGEIKSDNNTNLKASNRCQYDSALLNLPLPPQRLTEICKAIISSDVCKKEPPEKLLNCSKPDELNDTGLWDFLAGCSKGFFETAEQTLKFIEDLLKWAWDNSFSEEGLAKVGEQVQDYSQILKLYLYTEYEKAYALQDPPFKNVKAMKAMGGVISRLILSRIDEFITKQDQKLNCYNFEARSGMYCNAIGYIFVSNQAAISFVKTGSMLLEKPANQTSFAFGLTGK